MITDSGCLQVISGSINDKFADVREIELRNIHILIPRMVPLYVKVPSNLLPGEAVPMPP